ncbi:cupredoxin domain-containing protein [Paenibacillus cisolokensis]|jgi:Heme/copper-type cytochrome/quinol oxidases, subunit 2|uniref:Cytochrome C oxidase subunit II n=1 Tax=Paenibacillus cisolokensis TaxID=1658519 RepID=A0ABQ4NDG8_9BACL|nr:MULTISPECIES: cupredoxin domain-containing protein [Paenibacillus]ALS29352.1 subunit II of cytochrome C oxidase [Paenibacillus sp. 32O-W]GIQ66230.1 hypothetical protein PACILC2_47980 [Paenibacillus cisolokensis]
MKKTYGLLALIVVLSFALAACGGSTKEETPAGEGGDTGGAATGQEIVIKASNWQFDQSEYRVPKGQPFTLKLESTEGVHGIEVANTDIKLGNGESKTYTLDNAGDYELSCNVPCGVGHAKMKAKLVVE